MLNRRHRPLLQAVIFLGLIGALGYSVFLYNTLNLKLEKSDQQIRKFTKQQKSLSSQLQVVYEHRAKLEKSFEKEKSEHKKTKAELTSNKKEFLFNVTRAKHETRNRFNSLETQHRMLKAQHEELELEYNRLQQQHSRLSSEHQEVHRQQMQSFNSLKEQKKMEIINLEEQIKTFKEQAASLRVRLSEVEQDAAYYKGLHNKGLLDIQRQQTTIISLNQRLRELKKHQKSSIGEDVSVEHMQPNAHRLGPADTRPGVAHPRPPQLPQVSHRSTKANTIPTKEGEEEEEDRDDDAEQEKKLQNKQSNNRNTAPTKIPLHRDTAILKSAVAQRHQMPNDQSHDNLSRDRVIHPKSIANITTTNTEDSVRQVLPSTPKPVNVIAKTSLVHESEGEPRADADDETQAEEANVKRYLNQSLEAKLHQIANQDQSRTINRENIMPQRPQQRPLMHATFQNANTFPRVRESEQWAPVPLGGDVERPQGGEVEKPKLDRQDQLNRLKLLNPARMPHDSEQKNLKLVDEKTHKVGQPKENYKYDNIKLKETYDSKPKVVETLEEAGPKRTKGGEQYRRPIQRPGAVVKRKASEEDNENIEPNESDSQRKTSEEHAQEEDNDNEEGEEDPDENLSQTKQGEGRPLDQPRPNVGRSFGQSDKKIKRPNAAADNGDEEDGNNSDSRDKTKRVVNLRGLR
ncbi:Golgi integral membrane protein 4 [Nematostella vectensis]|uniref:Golgi integral membrane protein 4 n=1 Tax=Nematostella vectensis TaxID=45351 RepID=UPI0020775712|nr:Golgi integral membrane protein 4 [Nematostella vectensis]